MIFFVVKIYTEFGENPSMVLACGIYINIMAATDAMWIMQVVHFKNFIVSKGTVKTS